MIGVLINSIILMAILMCIGYYLRNKEILNDDGEKTLTYILVNITTPAMVINAMNLDFSIEQLKTGVFLLALAIGFVLILILLGSSVTVKIEDNEKKKIIKYSVVMMNGVYIGFPIAYQIYGAEGLFYATMFHIPNMIFMWTYGISILLGKKKVENRAKQMLVNPGMIGLYIGIFLYFTQLKLPLFVSNYLNLLTNTTTFLSMIIIGNKIATIGIKDSLIDKEAYFTTFFRLIISPLIMILIMKFLTLSEMIEQIYVLYASLPVAALMPILAQRYGGDADLGSKTVVITHLLSLFTIPFFFWLYTII